MYLCICSPTHLAQTSFVESSEFYSSIREGWCSVIGSFRFYMKISWFHSGSWKRVFPASDVWLHPSRPSPPTSWTLLFSPFAGLSWVCSTWCPVWPLLGGGPATCSFSASALPHHHKAPSSQELWTVAGREGHRRVRSWWESWVLLSEKHDWGGPDPLPPAVQSRIRRLGPPPPAG